MKSSTFSTAKSRCLKLTRITTLLGEHSKSQLSQVSKVLWAHVVARGTIDTYGSEG